MEREGKYAKIFLESTEEYVASIGNNYIQNFISDGTISKGFAAASNKRVYFKGICYTKTGNKLYKTNEERVVDLKDITGSGYNLINPVWMLITGVILCIYFLVMTVIGFTDLTNDFSDRLLAFCGVSWLASLPLGIAFLILHHIKKTTLFEIAYSGGKICFNIKWYSKSETDDFQRLIRLAKDNLTYTAAKTVTESQQNSNSNQSSADELIKYAELLKAGLITQEEFNKIKAKYIV